MIVRPSQKVFFGYWCPKELFHQSIVSFEIVVINLLFILYIHDVEAFSLSKQDGEEIPIDLRPVPFDEADYLIFVLSA